MKRRHSTGGFSGGSWWAAGLLILCLAICPAKAQDSPARPRTAPAKILIKADDFIGISLKWQRFLDIVNQHGLHASIGIICNSLEHASPQTLQWVKDVHAAGKIEFWNHGYDHREWKENGLTLEEFKGTPYEQQKEHLTRSDALAREKLGFAFRSFGAPFNATDAATVKVLAEEPNLKVWLYGDLQQPAGKTVLDRIPEVNIENPLFHPSLDKFVAGYRKHPEREYFLIQGHPPQWDETGFMEFARILDFLAQEKAVFLTPAEFAHLPPGGDAVTEGQMSTSPSPVTPPNNPPSSLPANTPEMKIKFLRPYAAAFLFAGALFPLATQAGESLISNGDFTSGMDGWGLNKLEHTDAEATPETIENGKHAIHIKVPQPGAKRYYVQLVHGGVHLHADKTYHLRFRAKCQPAGQIVLLAATNHTKFTEVWRQENVAVKTEWSDFTADFKSNVTDDGAVLLFSGLAAQAGDYWLTDISLEEGE